MSVSNLIHYFSSHPATFGIQSSSPPDNITSNPASKKMDQSLSEFQTGIGAAAHATHDMGNLFLILGLLLLIPLHLSRIPIAE